MRRSKVASAKCNSFYTYDEAVKFLGTNDIPRYLCPQRRIDGEYKYRFRDLLNYKKQL
jgi:hypothetical protein